jgi:uncharacterized membrane protein YqiK
MPDATLIIVAVLVIAILIAAVWWYSMRQRSAKLQETFGPHGSDRRPNSCSTGSGDRGGRRCAA